MSVKFIAYSLSFDVTNTPTPFRWFYLQSRWLNNKECYPHVLMCLSLPHLSLPIRYILNLFILIYYVVELIQSKDFSLLLYGFVMSRNIIISTSCPLKGFQRMSEREPLIYFLFIVRSWKFIAEWYSITFTVCICLYLRKGDRKIRKVLTSTYLL